ncbi:MAG TPA: hypothetical protein VGI95_06545 [Caulobacteraceae bacterium]
MATKYEPLGRRLRHATSDRIRFSFSEIESILGFALPGSARSYAPWWANTGGSHVQAKAWLDAGWRTCDVDVPGEQVSFERGAPTRPLMPEPPLDAVSGFAESAADFVADDSIVIARSDLRGGAIRMLEDYCEEKGGDLAGAIVGLLDEMALERRRRLIAWFRENSPRVPGDSTDLIREDRDAR